MTNIQPVAPAALAASYKALGDPTRLRIYEFLCECCGEVALDETGGARPVEGPTVGEVCCQVTGIERVTSTLSFHLKELRNAGLITMERRGRHVLCSANREALSALQRHVASLGCCSSDCATEGERK